MTQTYRSLELQLSLIFWFKQSLQLAWHICIPHHYTHKRIINRTSLIYYLIFVRYLPADPRVEIIMEEKKIHRSRPCRPLRSTRSRLLDMLACSIVQGFRSIFIHACLIINSPRNFYHQIVLGVASQESLPMMSRGKTPPAMRKLRSLKKSWHTTVMQGQSSYGLIQSPYAAINRVTGDIRKGIRLLNVYNRRRWSKRELWIRSVAFHCFVA